MVYVVGAQTYNESVTVDVPVGVSVYGGYAPGFGSRDLTLYPTTVQPAAPGNHTFVTNGGGALDGFIIQGSTAGQGGGIRCADDTGEVISNCTIQNCNGVQGSAIFARATLNNINLTIINCVIQNNTGDTGAGVYGQGVGVSINGGSKFISNTGHMGGAIYVTSGYLLVNGVTFTNNSAKDTSLLADAGGGAIFTNNSGLNVASCAFTNDVAQVSFTNNGTAKGGAIAAVGGTGVRIDRCTFNSCTATGSTVTTHYSWGGAVSTKGTNATFTNNFIFKCTAKGTGAVIPAYGGGISFENQGTPSIINNTFYGNEVTPNAGLVTDPDRPYGMGGAIFLTGSAGNTANIVNNIIAYSRGTAVVDEKMTVNFNYNVIWHNAGGDIYGFKFPTTNVSQNVYDRNIMADPNFRNVAANDFHILYGSPARDAGRNVGAPGLDIDGDNRPYYSGIALPPPVTPIVDIGADEFVDSGTPKKGGADNDPRGPATNDNTDHDGIYNPFDNCPKDSNPDQADSNGDGKGDVCTPLSTGAAPLVYYVDGTVLASGDGTSWGSAFKTIQEGINAADSHNQAGWTRNYEVWVRGGGVVGGQFYKENIMIWHGVAVYGGWAGTEVPSVASDPHPNRDLDANTTNINGNYVNSAVVIAHLPQDRYLGLSVKTIYDSLVTVLDGVRAVYGTAELGGGVSIYKDTANVANSRVQWGTAALGGGIYMYNTSSIVGDGLAPPPATLLSGSNWIFYNTATGAPSYAGFGGGVYTERGAPTIFGDLIEGNSAFYGGAIAARKSSPTIVESLIGCAFTGAPGPRSNTAQGAGTGDGKGGGIYMDNGSDVGMNKLTIVSNQATGASGQGGGIWDNNSNFTLKNSIVAYNTATHATSTLRGGAIFASGTAPVISNPWCFISYSDFYSNSAQQFVGLPDPTGMPPVNSCPGTNLAVNPQFMDPSNCVYRLAAGSPLLGAGDPLDGSPNIGAFQDVDPPVSIAEARTLANGVIVEISNAIVTAVFPDGFYIEDQARVAGIRVRKYNAPVSVGQTINVTGILTVNGAEREIMNPDITLFFLLKASAIGPYSMSNRQLGGASVGDLVKGVEDGVGPNNVGLLVQTWGKVTTIAGDAASFKIDDGSGVGVKVILPTGVSTPAVGDHVVVTGISCVDVASGNQTRAIRPRQQSDIRYPLR